MTGEELADHSSSKRPLSSSSRSSCGMQEHDFVLMNGLMFVSSASPSRVAVDLRTSSSSSVARFMNKH